MAFDPDAYLAKEDKKKGFDPDAYLAKTKPETALQTFGRSSASLADTALNALTGTLDVAAYPLARAFGRSPTQAQAETTSPKDVIGRAFGVTGTPGYEQAPLRQLGTYAGEVLGENVIQPLAQSTGLPEQDVGSMVNTGMMAAGAVSPKVLKPAYNTAKSAVQAAPEFTSGVVNTLSGRGTRPGERATYAGQYESARQPAGTTYNTPENLQAWREGLIDTAELNKRAVPYTADQAAALNRTGGMVPYSGQVARATGEALADPYTRLTGYIPDIALGVGGTMLGVGPVLGPALNLVRRGVQGAKSLRDVNSMRQLGDLGFSPMFPEELAAIQRGQPNPSVISPAAGPVRPPTPQAMAAQQINPAMATTPAAQAALATTQAKAQTIPPTRQLGYTPPRAPTMYVAPEGVAGTNLPQVEKAALQQRYAPQPVAQPAAQSASLFEAPLTTPEVTAAPKPLQVKATEGKTAEQIASEQKLLDLINQKAGRTTTPTTPAATVTEMPKASEVRGQLKLTAAGGIRGKDGVVQVNRTLFNDIAEKNGFDPIKWDTAPDVSKMGVADARKTIADFVDDQFKDQYTKGTRTSQTKIIKEAEAGKTAEQLAQEEAAALARVAKFANPSNPLNKTIKGSGGRGTMGLMTDPLEMITNKPSAAKKIDDVAWSTPEEFDNQVFMNTIGKGADKEFIAKGIFPEGKIIRAIDKKTDSEAVQYNNGDGFMIRKTPKSTESQYSILNKDGTMYEINKTKDSITRVEIRKNDKIIAEYNASPNKQGSWWVAEDTPNGGSMMVYKNDLGISKNPNTRKLHQQLPKINFSDILNEQLAKLQSLKEGK